MTPFDPVPLADGVEVDGPALTDAARRLLTPDVVALVARLHREMEPQRRQLLASRAERQARYDAGALPGFVPDDEHPEARGDWFIAPLPPDMLRRRVEITGPVNDAKMVINMLSRNDEGVRADAAMLDFEDSMKPSWANVVAGVENVMGAADGTLEFVKRGPDGEALKTYRLDPADMPLLMVRVRGLHLDEANVRVNPNGEPVGDGEAVSAGLFDLVLVACHTARTLLEGGKTPAFYVPKCEHYCEARWWNRLFTAVEQALVLPVGTFKATFLIETLPAAFQIEEILYEIRDHAAGLNVGRWDKIFSDIKTLRTHPDRVLADRASIGLNRPWMRAYAEQLVRVCHRHGAFAMGGMAAFTPGRTPEARAAQTQKVAADKEFEAQLGHDGCWVSHPYFIGPAMRPFTRDHQLDVIPATPERPDLLPQGGGPYTVAGLRTNVRVGIAYLKGWRDDVGCVAWDDLMEDLATLEISRAQVNQWRYHGVRLDSGEEVTDDLVRRVFAEELEKILGEVADADREAYRTAARKAEAVFLERDLRPFLVTQSDLAVAEPEPALA